MGRPDGSAPHTFGIRLCRNPSYDGVPGVSSGGLRVWDILKDIPHTGLAASLSGPFGQAFSGSTCRVAW